MKRKINKVCFVHDHVFRYDENGDAYSPGAFSVAVWERYFHFSDRLTVCGRSQNVRSENLGAKFQKVTADNVSFEKLPNIIDIKRYFAAKRESRQRLTQIIQRHDAVICRLPSEQGLLAASICRKLGKPYFVEVAGDVWDALWHRGSLMGKLYTPLQTLRVRKAIKVAPFVIYVTRDALQRRYPTDGVTTHASNVVLQETAPNVLEQKFRKNSERPEVTTLGIIGSPELKYKGVHFAARSLKELAAEGHKLHLRLLGPGDDKSVSKFLDRLGISDIATYHGTLPPGEPVLQWIDGLDIYMQPSLQEGLPRATIEAMSRGAVAVGSNVAGIPELLDSAHVFDRKKPAQLTDILRNILGKRDEWDAISKRNFETAQDYTIGAISQRRNAFYKDFTDYAFNENGR